MDCEFKMRDLIFSQFLVLLWLFGTANSSLYTIIKAGWDVHEIKDFETKPAKTWGLLKAQLKVMDDITALTKPDSVSKYAALLGIEELHSLNNHLYTINTSYNFMKKFVDTNQNLQVDLAKTIVANNTDSILVLTDDLHTFFFHPQSTQRSLLSDVGLELKNLNPSTCVLENSPREIITQLSSVFALGMIKAYTLVQFSYALLNANNKGSYYEQQRKYRDAFSVRMYELLACSKEVIQNASDELLRCDPKVHVEGETYVQFTNYLQGYIQHEIFLNAHHSCSNDCSDYHKTSVHHQTDMQINSNKRCNGNVLECRSLNYEVTVCPSKNSSTRRYDFIKPKHGLIQGRKVRCSLPTYNLSSYLALVIVGYECSFCFCFCDDDLTDKFISMRTSRSDFRHNRVVTGVRFIKDNGLIKMQVQEGKLMKYGRIDKKTVRWVQVNNFSRTSEDTYLNQDYYRLTPETSTLYLDDVRATEDHVVIGVRFKMLGSGLVFEILISPYDFSTGKLIQPVDRSYWVDNISAIENRRQINLEAPDIPILRGPPHTYVKRSNEVVRFRSTDIEKDLAQTTVPFFDAQPLFSETPVPLSGVGIFHKGREGSGGFIAPKIITQDYSGKLQNKPNGQKGK